MDFNFIWKHKHDTLEPVIKGLWFLLRGYEPLQTVFFFTGSLNSIWTRWDNVLNWEEGSKKSWTVLHDNFSQFTQLLNWETVHRDLQHQTGHLVWSQLPVMLTASLPAGYYPTIQQQQMRVSFNWVAFESNVHFLHVSHIYPVLVLSWLRRMSSWGLPSRS